MALLPSHWHVLVKVEFYISLKTTPTCNIFLQCMVVSGILTGIFTHGQPRVIMSTFPLLLSTPCNCARLLIVAAQGVLYFPLECIAPEIVFCIRYNKNKAQFGTFIQYAFLQYNLVHNVWFIFMLVVFSQPQLQSADSLYRICLATMQAYNCQCCEM